MKGLVEFSIPVKGLGNGMHQFRFHIGGEFFEHFEGSPVQEGDIDLILDFDKRSDMYVLQFDFEGTIRTECDRCLAEIDLPVSGKHQLLVKFSLEEEPEEAEVVYINPETQQFNVAKYAYEFIILSIPIIKVYDCENDENRVCNEEMLKYLEEDHQGQDTETSQENPVWEELRKLKGDN